MYAWFSVREQVGLELCTGRADNQLNQPGSLIVYWLRW